MSFTAYASAVAGSVLTASFWNAQVKNNGGVIITSIDTATGKLNASDGLLIGPRLTKVSTVVAASSISLDLALGSLFEVTITANWNGFSMSTALFGSLQFHNFYVKTIGNGTPFTNGLTPYYWPGGSAPTPTSTNAHWDLYHFVYDAHLAKLYGETMGQNYS